MTTLAFAPLAAPAPICPVMTDIFGLTADAAEDTSTSLSSARPPYGRLRPPPSPASLEGFLAAMVREVEHRLRFEPSRPLLLAGGETRGESGVYLLRYGGELTYIGASERCVQTRLVRAQGKVAGARLLTLESATYRYAPCQPSAALAVERELIAHYAPPWNRMGFGSNVAGAGRARQRVSEWDATFGRDVRA